MNLNTLKRGTQILMSLFFIAANPGSLYSQGCFCDAVIRDKGSFMLGPVAEAGALKYEMETGGQHPHSYFSGGITFGIKISEKMSLHSGIRYLDLKEVMISSYYPKMNAQIFEFPLELSFFFPVKSSPLVPFLGLSGTLQYMQKMSFFIEGESIPSEVKTGSGSFYLGPELGFYYLFSDHLSIRLGAFARLSVPEMTGFQENYHYVNAPGGRISFNFHF
jgi:hypothetical protein